MNWEVDKIKHYKVGYQIGLNGSIFGFLLVALILAPGKEFFDIMGFGHAEFDDYKAGVIGAFDGMILRESRF